jgi:hypothetical protein
MAKDVETATAALTAFRAFPAVTSTGVRKPKSDARSGRADRSQFHQH